MCVPSDLCLIMRIFDIVSRGDEDHEMWRAVKGE